MIIKNRTDDIVFNSSFKEGITYSLKKGITGRLEPETGIDHLQQIEVQEDFDLFHNILHYIYQGRITFASDLKFLCENHPKHPNRSNVEDIYAIADRMLLDDLKLRAGNFLYHSCTIENIMDRLASPTVRPDVAQIYQEYFLNNFKSIEQHSKRFKELLNDQEQDAELRIAVPEIIYEVFAKHHRKLGDGQIWRFN